MKPVMPLGRFMDRTVVFPENPGLMPPFLIQDAGGLCFLQHRATLSEQNRTCRDGT
jgi:hypothetical protein